MPLLSPPPPPPHVTGKNPIPSHISHRQTIVHFISYYEQVRLAALNSHFHQQSD